MKILIHPYSRVLQNNKPNPKNYIYWDKLVPMLIEDGHELIQIGVDGEPRLCDNFKKNIKFAELKKLIQETDLYISIDSFLQHATHYYGVKGIVLFSISDPKYFGYQDNTNLFVSPDKFRKNQFDLWENSEFDESAFIQPELIREVVQNWKK